MSNTIHILLVEDSEDDALLVIRHIQRAGYDVVYERVIDSAAMTGALERKPWDLVIADYMLPAFNGLAALAIMKQKNIDLPFIIVSGTIGEDVAVQAMKAGAHDYVMKGNLNRLIPAIQREIAEAESRRQRRRAEEAYREAEERYRGLFEGTRDAIYFSTVDGSFIDINPAGIKLFGYHSKEEFLNAGIRLIDYVDPQQCLQRNELLSRDGFVRDFEFTLTRRDGTSAVVLETSLPVRDAQGTVTMYRSILRDVTQQKQLEQQFVQAQKMESIGTLAGGIAHDFNNILGIILGYGNLLMEKRTNLQEFSEAVSTIIQAVERGASLVQKIFTFANESRKDRLGAACDVEGNIPEDHRDTGRIFDGYSRYLCRSCTDLPGTAEPLPECAGCDARRRGAVAENGTAVQRTDA